MEFILPTPLAHQMSLLSFGHNHLKKYSFQPCFCALYHKILPKKSIIMTLKIFQAISTVALRYQLLYIQTQLGELVAVPAL
ncbi:hypothetical protein [Thiolapillus sp.]|nr:hypothetical protein [Thiolapillus sp.]